MATLLPPSSKQIVELNKIIMKSIKCDTNILPRYSIFQQSYSTFGLQAPVLSDILIARKVNIWIKLLTGNFLWAKIERNIIEQQIFNSRGISISIALPSNPISTKSWPSRWKPFVKAWKKVEGTIGKNKESWPWVPESIALAHEQGNTYSIKKVVQFLRNKSISTSITQNNLIKELPSSTTPLHCNWIPNKKVDILWRLLHRALSLGYYLRKIISTESGNCI